MFLYNEMIDLKEYAGTKKVTYTSMTSSTLDAIGPITSTVPGPHNVLQKMLTLSKHDL